MATASDIQNLYIAYFNRPADVAGLAYWQTVPSSLLQIAQSFSQQLEYASAFAGYTTKQTVNTLYGNLFNHVADSAGLDYWTGQIDSGAVSIGAAAIAILGGATGADQVTVQAKNTAATAFTASLASNAQAQMLYNPVNGSFAYAKTWLGAVLDASTGAAAAGGLATAINNYKATGGDTVTLGSGAQTVNFYNTSGNEVVVTGGINQSVNQVTQTTGSLTVNTSHANTLGLTVNAANATGGANITFSDAGKASLTAATLSGVSAINLFAAQGEVLTLSPTATLAINQAAAAATINAMTAQTVTVNQASTSDITLGGTGNYIVSGGTTGSITANGNAGSLKVIDTGNSHVITSSVSTTIDAKSGTVAGGYHSDTLIGTGNFTVTGVGFQNMNVFDGGVKGSVNIVTTGSNLSSYVEGSKGTGAVTVTLGGTGMCNIHTESSHLTTINAVKDVNNFVSAGGSGAVTYNAAASGNTLFLSGSTGAININLSATGNGADSLNLNIGGDARLGAIATSLTTIANFKTSGADKIYWGIAATSLGAINIGSSDFAALATNIQSGAGTLTNGDGKAFIVNVGSGTAAGTYLYEHVNQSAAVTGIDLIVKLVGAGAINASDILGRLG
ncbi:DUF4214 domain-containing protein [Undibacterium sp. TS12]|uniref:beta strand repeat-containing protein n=1 Tax=Undibacterium sp. TS12 TaxID=2908202 RepID=UPI001F4D30D8|nr:DUF4214 domain-containing protein [Undibacterium sp. TS12]MCH8617719.1 DUF4214 domain-containing protein [Undibacterium sp. TS12]